MKKPSSALVGTAQSAPGLLFVLEDDHTGCSLSQEPREEPTRWLMLLLLVDDVKWRALVRRDRGECEHDWLTALGRIALLAVRPVGDVDAAAVAVKCFAYLHGDYLLFL